MLLSAVPRGPLAKLDATLAVATGTVAVEAYANAGRADGLARAERRLGATDLTRHGRAVYADVPATSLAALAALPSLRFARSDTLVTHAGAATSQGDTADRAAAARSTYGITGAGVTVGILSDSFNDSGNADTYATDVASGDLPAKVQVLAEDKAAGTDEGRAMAQVIYDSAPGAGLAFATATGGQATMAANIASLVKAGAKVIVDDVSYLAEPMFQDGPIAKAVAAATAAGVSYFTAAGETASRGYASSWRSAGQLGSIPSATGAPADYGGTLFNFAADGTVNPYNAFTLPAGQSLTLSFQWDSPYYSVSGGSGSPNQVDAYVLNAAGTQIVGGGVNYDIGGDPVQVFTFTNTTGATGTFNLALATEAGSALPGYLKYVDFAGAATNWTYGFNSGSIFGHANAAPAGAGLEAVGSANYLNTPAYGTSPPVLEASSATGTTPILFDAAGNRLATPVVRQSPGIVAPDNVDDTFFGTDTDGDGKPNFTGTSAAAASAAGVAALLLSKVSTLSPAALDNALQSTALDMGAAGVDTQSGYGLIQADAAVAAAVNATAGTVTGTVFVDANSNGTLDAGEAGYSGGATVYDDLNKNGVRDAGEPYTTAATDGTFALAGVPVGSAVVIRAAVPNGFVATTAVRTVAVTAGTTVAAVTLGLFPYTFTGTTGNDAYVVQVDPTTKANIDVIVTTAGASTTYTDAKASLPALVISPGTGDDTLTVNFGASTIASPIPGTGLTYDGGAGTNALILSGVTGTDSATITGQQTVYDSSTINAFDIASETLNGNGGSDTTTINSGVTSGQAFTVNGGVGTATLTIKATLANNGAGYTLNGGTAAGDLGVLNVNNGTYALTGDPSVTSANLTVNVNTGGTLLRPAATVAATAASATLAVNVNAGGALIFPAAAPGTGVNARLLTALTVAATATVTAAQAASHADRAVLVTNTLAVATGGRVDLADNDLVVQAGNLATITALAATGYAGGAWTGPGLASAAANADATHTTGLGVIANSSTLYNASTPFDGVAPAAAAVLVKFTYYGDSNLDGVVNLSDYTRTDNGYITAGATGWANGDYNYDGLIDGSDYTLIDTAFNTQTTPL